MTRVSGIDQSSEVLLRARGFEAVLCRLFLIVDMCEPKGLWDPWVLCAGWSGRLRPVGETGAGIFDPHSFVSS